MKRKDIIYITIIIILIIIILLLLFRSNFWKIDNDKRVPTGNLDVFDIDVKCDTSNDKCEYKSDKQISSDDSNNNYNKKNNNYSKKIIDKNNKNSSNTSNNSNNSDSNNNSSENETEEITDEEMIYVDDTNGNYIYQNTLDIFNNAAFNYTNKIAPGVYNTYDFEVHNSSNTKIKYSIDLFETTQYKINLKYRIRKNNKYIAGDKDNYVSLNEIDISNMLINPNSKDKYSVDWKWFDDDENDTIAGEKMTEQYKLSIRIYFEKA